MHSQLTIATTTALCCSSLFLACCCIPNGGYGDRRDAFQGTLIKNTPPTPHTLAATYDCVLFGAREKSTIPSVQVTLNTDGTWTCTGDIAAFTSPDDFKGVQTPKASSSGTWRCSTRDHDNAITIVFEGDVRSEWYLLQHNDALCFATWIGDPDSFEAIQFERISNPR